MRSGEARWAQRYRWRRHVGRGREGARPPQPRGREPATPRAPRPYAPGPAKPRRAGREARRRPDRARRPPPSRRAVRSPFLASARAGCAETEETRAATVAARPPRPSPASKGGEPEAHCRRRGGLGPSPATRASGSGLAGCGRSRACRAPRAGPPLTPRAPVPPLLAPRAPPCPAPGLGRPVPAGPTHHPPKPKLSTLV